MSRLKCLDISYLKTESLKSGYHLRKLSKAIQEQLCHFALRVFLLEWARVTSSGQLCSNVTSK